ncbi:MAG: hypothetical protein R2932_25065 [Caldilineaceae bacterium]
MDTIFRTGTQEPNNFKPQPPSTIVREQSRFCVNLLLPSIGAQEAANDTGFWLISKYSYLLVIAAFLAELLLPIIIWKTPIPGATRWIADGLVFVIAILACMRMLLFDRLPSGVLLVIGTIVIGAVVAAFEGQPMLATVWGVWRMFMYPMVAFFVYLQPLWPQQIASKLFRGMVWLLGMEVFVQIAQYGLGQVPGDNLAGTFGWKGVGSLVMFVFLVLCLSFGKWLVSGDWLQLAS